MKRQHFTRLIGVGFVIALFFVTDYVSNADGQERTFAGSAQGSYLYVPTDLDANQNAFDGFTAELSLKVSGDINEHISAQAKLCFGCHGFELGLAFVDFRAHDFFNVRVGRFNPAFGEFYLRHDPANHRTVDKPLPYDMGRMVRLRDWNMSVLPVPYVDSGIELSGTAWLNDNVQFDYAAYAVGGLRGPSDGLDLNFVQSRSSYYIDNNSSPAFGGRLLLTLSGGSTLASVGVSGMWGTYDPDRELQYIVAGVDAFFRHRSLTIRAEYLIRYTEMGLGRDPLDRFRYGPGDDGEFDAFFLKDGFYLETELEVHPMVQLVARFDGRRRFGNVSLNSELRKSSAVLRYTAGLNITPHAAVRIKLFGEYYDFSDFSDEVAVQVGVASAF